MKRNRAELFMLEMMTEARLFARKFILTPCRKKAADPCRTVQGRVTRQPPSPPHPLSIHYLNKRIYEMTRKLKERVWNLTVVKSIPNCLLKKKSGNE